MGLVRSFIGTDGIWQYIPHINTGLFSIIKVHFLLFANLIVDWHINTINFTDSGRYCVSSGETYAYENIVAYDFCIDEQSIYYVSRTDGNLVYSCDKDGNNKELIGDVPAMLVTCDADGIYVLAKEDGEKIVLNKNR